MLIYMLLVSKLQDLISYLVTHGEDIGGNIMRYLYPFYLMGRGCLGDVGALLIILAITAAIFLVIWFLVQKNFISIVTATGHAKGKVYRGGGMVARTAASALYRKELKRLSSSAVYIMNSCMNVIFLLIIPVILLTRRDQVVTAIANIPPVFQGTVFVIIAAFLCFMMVMGMMTAASVSLEGSSLWVIRTLPVSSKSVLMAKVKLQVSIYLLPLIFTTAILGYIFSASPLNIILLFVLVVLCEVFTAEVGLIENLKRPRFDWKNEAVVIKQSAAVGFSMLICGLVAAAVFLPYIFLLSGLFGGAVVINGTVYLIIACAIYLVLALLLFRWISTKGAKIFDEL